MNYEESIQKIMTLSDIERLPEKPMRSRYNLEKISKLLDLLGKPHEYSNTVHITGTKGKGSTAAMIVSGLLASGKSVGMYSSPHLHTIRERIQVNGKPISEKIFAEIASFIWEKIDSIKTSNGYEKPSFFEFMTAMAFYVFKKLNLQWQIIEVGLGGTLDATNVLENSKICVLTSISLDHTKILGNSVGLIAKDKSGIIKIGSKVVSAPQPKTALKQIIEKCNSTNSSLTIIGNDYRYKLTSSNNSNQKFQVISNGETRLFEIPLLGEYQVENATIAIAVLDLISHSDTKINNSSIYQGLKTAYWPARMEIISESPTVIVDGAHNPYSMKKMIYEITNLFPNNNLIFIYGCSIGHDVKKITNEIVKINPKSIFLANSRHPRSMDTGEIATMIPNELIGHSGTVEECLNKAKALMKKEDIIIATGSLFIAAEVRESIMEIAPELY